jgi:thiol-disulfide isomerase/thioredoxin
MLFGIISWSEVGLIYYSSLLVIIATLEHLKIASILTLISFVTLPYVFYSIYYQWRIAKSWCPLCITVQGLFVIQAAVALATGQYWPVNPEMLLYMVLITSICTLVLFLLKPIIEKSIKFDYTEISFNKFKHLPQIETLILRGDYVDTSTLEKISLFPDQKYMITFIFSLTCSPCLRKLKKLKEILEIYDNVGLELVFCVKDIKQGTDIPIIRYFLDRFYKSPHSLMGELEEYAKNYTIHKNKLLSYIPDPLYKKETNQIFLNHNEWFVKNNFIGTPVILLNNHQMPSAYQLEDIEYVISRD